MSMKINKIAFSIKTRIILLYTLLFGILLGLIAFGGLKMVERNYINSLDTYLISYTSVIEGKIVRLQDKGHEYLNAAALRLSKHEIMNINPFHFGPPEERSRLLPEILFKVVDLKGKIIVSGPKDADSESKIQWKIKSPRHRDHPTSFAFADIGEQHFRTYKRKILTTRPDSSPLTIEIAASLEALDLLRHHIGHHHLFISFFTLLLAGTGAYLIIRYAFKPVTRMARTAGIISAGSLYQRLDLPKAKDEIHMLGETLNQMIHRIALAFESQQQFIGNASHEVRTPLTIIQAELELALSKIKNPDVKQSIEISLQEVEHLSRLAQSMLTLSRLDVGEDSKKPEPVRLDELIVETLHSFRQVAQKDNITLDLSIAETSTGNFEILAKPPKIKRMLSNIIDNAIKYSRPNSAISVNLDIDNDSRIMIIVNDQGAGISEKALPQIFERFYRAPDTRNDIMGSGLGLAIVKKIVDLYDGDITVESQKNKGTSVKIRFPQKNSAKG